MLNSIQIEETNCPLCHSRRHRRLFADGRRRRADAAEFAVVECDACGLRFTNPRPTRKSMSIFYPGTYGPYQGFDSNGLSLFDAGDSIVAHLKNDLKYTLLTQHYGCRPYPSPRPAGRFNLLPRGIRLGIEYLALRYYKRRNPRVPPCNGNRKALDVGCGNGHYLLFLKQLGWDVTGFDRENHVVPAVSEAGIPVFTGSLKSVLRQRPPGAFSLITMWHVLEHFYDPAAELACLRTLLSAGGTLLIEVPNSASPSAKLLRRHWHQWDLPRHLSHFTPGSLARLLSTSGFRVTKLSRLHKTALPQSLRCWVEKEGGWKILKPFVKMDGFNRALGFFDSPLALVRTGENLLATAVK